MMPPSRMNGVSVNVEGHHEQYSCKKLQVIVRLGGGLLCNLFCQLPAAELHEAPAKGYTDAK